MLKVAKEGKERERDNACTFSTLWKKKEYNQGGWHCRVHFLLRLEEERNMKQQKETTKQNKSWKGKIPHALNPNWDFFPSFFIEKLTSFIF
jgi:hypothetical protein